MEHTVGQRQFPDAEKYKEILVKLFHVPEDKVEERFHRDAEASRTFAPTYREAVCRMASERGIAVAAHDDENLEHVEEAARLGMTISEFPDHAACRRGSPRPRPGDGEGRAQQLGRA